MVVRWLFKFTLLVLLVSLFSGCFFGSTADLRRLNVTWRVVETSFQSMNKKGEGEFKMDEMYYGNTRGGSLSEIYVEANIDGDTSGDFEFDVVSSNDYDKIANNVLRIKPDLPEKGTIAVKSQGLEKIVGYEIFPANIISANPLERHLPVGFYFKLNKRVDGKKGDLYMYGDSDKIYAKVGAIISKEADAFWEDFAEVNNLHEYEYEEMSFEPDFMKIYLIKCEEGYAAVMFETASLRTWGFIYKYSETGVFE